MAFQNIEDFSRHLPRWQSIRKCVTKGRTSRGGQMLLNMMNSVIAGTVYELTFIKVKWTNSVSYSAASVAP
jgi:hypothetical protein